MGNGATVNVRVDAHTKNQAQDILRALGMNLSEAVSLFLRQIIFNRGIPFEVKIPNELTMKTVDKSERGEGLHEVKSVEELMKELNT